MREGLQLIAALGLFPCTILSQGHVSKGFGAAICCLSPPQAKPDTSIYQLVIVTLRQKVQANGKSRIFIIIFFYFCI